MNIGINLILLVHYPDLFYGIRKLFELHCAIIKNVLEFKTDIFFLRKLFLIVLKMNTATSLYENAVAALKKGKHDELCKEIVKNYSAEYYNNYSDYGTKFNFRFKTNNRLSIEQLNHIGARLCSYFSEFVTPEIMESEDESKSFYIGPQANFETQSVQIHFGQNTPYTSITDVPLIEF